MLGSRMKSALGATLWEGVGIIRKFFKGEDVFTAKEGKEGGQGSSKCKGVELWNEQVMLGE